MKKNKEVSEIEKKWKKNRGNSGKEYEGTIGIIKPAKSFKEHNHNCRYQGKNISKEKCQAVFKEIWALH